MNTLAHIDNAQLCFITFRPSCSEPQVFEDFVAILLPHISLKFPFYIYAIEADDTPSRHIHILLQHKEKETKFLKQKIESKWYKDFSKSLKDKSSKMKVALHYGKGPDGEDFGFTMKIEDKMKAIGYIFKDITRRHRIDSLSQEVITQCCDFYYSNRRIKNSTENDIKIINNKNFHIKCEEFAKQNSLTVRDYSLVARMTFERHSFQISARDLKKYLAELKFMNAPEYSEKSVEFQIINEFQKPEQEDDLIEYIKYLVEKLKSNGIDYKHYHDAYWSQ